MGRITSSPQALHYLTTLGISDRRSPPPCPGARPVVVPAPRPARPAWSVVKAVRRWLRVAAIALLFAAPEAAASTAVAAAEAAKSPARAEEPGDAVALVGVLLLSVPVLLSASLVFGFAGGVTMARRPRRFHPRARPNVHRAPTARVETASSVQAGAKPFRPTACSRFWGVGVASQVGPVRRENQDRALAWDQGVYRVLVVADGMGGLPRGGQAAQTATRALSRCLAASLVTDEFLHTPLDVLHRSFAAAAAALHFKHALEGGSGLRTTLIAVVCTVQAYFHLFIGDGGFWVRRVDGTLEAVLKPQKDPETPHLLDASLGPLVQGEPVLGMTARRPGDVLLVGTDGVFDRLGDPAAFASSIVDGARTFFGGDVQRTVDEVVRQFSEARDDDGHPICDDNLTLILAVPDNTDPSAFGHEVSMEDGHA